MVFAKKCGFPPITTSAQTGHAMRRAGPSPPPPPPPPGGGAKENVRGGGGLARGPRASSRRGTERGRCQGRDRPRGRRAMSTQGRRPRPHRSSAGAGHRPLLSRRKRAPRVFKGFQGDWCAPRPFSRAIGPRPRRIAPLSVNVCARIERQGQQIVTKLEERDWK